MDARQDSAEEVKELSVNGDERKRGCIDRGAEKAAILLNLDENMYRPATAGKDVLG